VPRPDWFWEEPRREPGEYAVDLARDRFWRDEQKRLIGTHPDFPDAAWLLDLNEELAHGLILVLSRIPEERRWSFADLFFAERRGGTIETPNNPSVRLAAGASVALLVLELAADELRGTRIEDLLAGAAQGDDLTHTPLPAVTYLQKAVARERFNVEFENLADPRGAASLAVAEVLVPASEVVALKEVVARSCWAAVESWESPRVLAFLLQLAHTLDAHLAANS
jgi:hypothetical protein